MDKNDDSIMKYVGGNRKVIEIPEYTVFKGLIDILNEKCHID